MGIRHKKIDKAGKLKEELLKCLEKLKENYGKEINEYNLRLLKIDGGYNIKTEKSVLFMDFYLDATIIAKDGYYDLRYKTNVPSGIAKDVLNKIEEALAEC
jgi:hypothetical protein